MSDHTPTANTAREEQDAIDAARYAASFVLYSEDAQIIPAAMSHRKGSDAAPVLLNASRATLAAAHHKPPHKDSKITGGEYLGDTLTEERRAMMPHDPPRMCTGCAIPHVENCALCWGFGLYESGTR